MKKKIAIGIMLTLILTSIATLAFNIQPAKASGTIYIRADGSIDPPTAPIQRVGDVYTLTGHITSNADGIVIERNNMMLDGAGYVLQGTEVSYSKGISLSGQSNVTIKDININNFHYGVLIEDSFQINVFGNNVTNNRFGIMLSSSSNNTLVGNVISGNGYNFGVSGAGSWDNAFLYQFIHRVDISNLIEGKPIYYWVNEKDKAVPLDAGYVALVNCTRITVQNLNLTKNWQGILLHSTSNSTITRNNITLNYYHGVELQHCSNISVIGNDIMANNGHGVSLSWSFNNALSGNKIANNFGGAGIYLSGPSNNNSIIGNTISANADGITLWGCSNCVISENNVANNRFGILLEYSSYNIVSGNNATANNWYGIGLYESSNNNTISGNSMIANKEAGIAFSESSNNKIYHNNFLNNADQVHISGGYVNVWDDDYPSGGNYWSDYAGVDEKSGPNQDQLGSDSIGDTPYVIDADNRDRYPLMQPRIPIPLPVYNINTGSGYGTIQAAINAANSGDTILVKEGTYHEHIIVNKSITLIGENRDRTIIDGSSTGTVINITVSHVTITGFTIQNSGSHPYCGIYVSSSFNNISYNIIKNGPAYYIGYAIKLFKSSNNILFGNFITSNPSTAVLLDNSSNNVISENNITDNEYGIGLSGKGLEFPESPLFPSSNNIISKNNITNNKVGISFYRSPNNVVYLNNIVNNTKGIDIIDYPSTNNTIYGNNITSNTFGIYSITINNKIYHNNFINNSAILSWSHTTMVWDNGYPSGGNYWGDYSGVDQKRGPNQDQLGSDGIGDTPYVIYTAYWDIRDRYPLMNPWTPSWTPPEYEPVTPTPGEVQVGVKAGHWIKYDYIVTGWPAGTPYPLWLKVEFLSVEGTSTTVRVTMRMSDGTEQNATVPVDVVAGGQALGLSGFVIPANLTTGDTVFMSGYGNVTIAGETTRTYAGASRTVVYASISQYGTQLTYYWDKQTGVLVEASGASGGMTLTAKATETNMWQAAPAFPIDPLILMALIAIVIVIVIAVLLVHRKKKPTETQKPETQP